MLKSEQVITQGVQETTAVSHSGAAKIAVKILAVMREVGYVQKDGKNDFQNYNYATEGNAIRALRPALVKHGLFLIPSVETVQQDEFGNTHVTLLYRIFDEEGNHISFRAAGSGNDRNSKGVGDKGIYKALTGASKYALLKTFLMETGDDPEVPSEQDKKDEKREQDKRDLAKVSVPFLMEIASTCVSVEELTELWSANADEIKKISKVDKEGYDSLVAHFKKLKSEKSNG